MIEFTEQNQKVVTEKTYTAEAEGYAYTINTRHINDVLDQVNVNIVVSETGMHVGNMAKYSETKSVNLQHTESLTKHVSVFEAFLESL